MAHIKRMNSLKEVLSRATSQPTLENIDRMLKSDVYIKPEKKLKKKSSKKRQLNEFSNVKRLDQIENLKENYEIKDEIKRDYMVKNEQPFILKQYLDKNRHINESSHYFLKHRYLSKPSIEPEHLTVLDENFAQETSKLIKNNLNKSTTHFIDMQPGIGLILKNFLNQIDNDNQEQYKQLNNFMFIEPRKEYLSYLIDIKSQYNKKYNIEILKKKPFDKKFKLISDINRFNSKFDKNSGNNLTLNQMPNDVLTIFGIVPWNCKGFLLQLYQQYCFDYNLFSLYSNFKQIEYFLYIPEFMLARLQPELEDNFVFFNSALSIYSNIFSKMNVLTKQDLNYFHPYALLQKMDNMRPLKFPLNLINMKNMYLINIKFDLFSSDPLVDIKYKRKFFYFINQLWSQPNVNILNALKCIGVQATAKNSSSLTNDFLKFFNRTQINIDEPIRSMHSLQFLELFNYLIENESINVLNSAKYDRSIQAYEINNFVFNSNNENDVGNQKKEQKLKKRPFQRERDNNYFKNSMMKRRGLIKN